MWPKYLPFYKHHDWYLATLQANVHGNPFLWSQENNNWKENQKALSIFVFWHNWIKLKSPPTFTIFISLNLWDIATSEWFLSPHHKTFSVAELLTVRSLNVLRLFVGSLYFFSVFFGGLNKEKVIGCDSNIFEEMPAVWS